jgi:hypothetical protein
MVSLLKRLVGLEAERVPPALVRLRSGDGFADGPVLVEALWDGSARAQVWRTHASQGLCVVPWQAGRRVRIRFSHHETSAEVELTYEDARLGSATELWLERPRATMAATATP